MVHSTVLIQVRDPLSKLLSYTSPPPGYTGPLDDIIMFACNVRYHGLSMHVDNRAFYGWILVPLESTHTLEDEKEEFLHTKLENIG